MFKSDLKAYSKRGYRRHRFDLRRERLQSDGRVSGITSGNQSLSVDVMVGAYYVKVSADLDIHTPLGDVSRIQDIDFTDWFAIPAGYKYWYFKYEDDEKPLSELEQKLYGPVIGIQFKF